MIWLLWEGGLYSDSGLSDCKVISDSLGDGVRFSVSCTTCHLSVGGSLDNGLDCLCPSELFNVFLFPVGGLSLDMSRTVPDL